MRSWIGSVILLVGSLGCAEVVSTHPVGEQPVQLAAEDWEGTWLGGEGALVIRVVDASKGVLEAAWIEEETDGFRLQSARVELRSFEDWTFASLRPTEEDTAEPYLWLRLESDGVEMLGWWPRKEPFAEMVERGVLPGRDDNGTIVLSRLTAEHLARIRSESERPLFEWEDPLVLHRWSH